MKTRDIKIIGFIALTITLTACKINKQTATKKQNEMEITNKQKVVDLLKSIETGAQKPVSYVNPNKYIQHNTAVEDGLVGFGKLLQQLPPNSTIVNTIRAFEDEEFVFTHTEYNFFGPKIGFDIFRFENGSIVEHWDNLQETPENLNPSGNSMIDGSVEILDINSTEVNKILVKNFIEDILVSGKMEKLTEYFDGNNYIQHNPQIGNGLTGLGTALEYMALQGITMKYTKIHKILGEGNFILAVSEGTFAGKPTSFYDLFRVKNGKIAEHWDTIETITPKKSWKNNNGKF